MSREVPSWVYRRQLEALEHVRWHAAAERPSPPIEADRSKGAADPVSGPSRTRLTEGELQELLGIEWSEVRRLVDSGRLPAHRPDGGYGRCYVRADVDALIESSLRGSGPTGRARPRRRLVRDGAAVGFAVVTGREELFVSADHLDVTEAAHLIALDASRAAVARFPAGRWRFAVQALSRRDDLEPKGHA